MRGSLLVRAAVALVCVLGVVASVIAYRSQKNFDDGFNAVVLGHLDERSKDLLEDSETLNPDARIDFALGLIAREQGRDWRPLIESAIEREPENVGIVARYAELLEQEGREAEAQRMYDRASELDPARFPPRRGGG